MNTRTVGAAATAAWIAKHRLDISDAPHWYVEIMIPTDSSDTRFELNIYPEEWGIVFRRGTRVSSIRVTDVAFVHGLDQYQLMPRLPPLEQIEELLAWIEDRYDIAFHRIRATIRSNLIRATALVRPWLVGAR